MTMHNAISVKNIYASEFFLKNEVVAGEFEVI